MIHWKLLNGGQTISLNIEYNIGIMGLGLAPGALDVDLGTRLYDLLNWGVDTGRLVSGGPGVVVNSPLVPEVG